MAEHYLDASLTHNFWDNSHPPRLVIDPGDTIVFECRDPSDGQVTPATTVADLAGHDPSRIHPLTGPVYIRSAQPGDALAVEILAMHHHGWGFTLIVPNAALLGDEFRADYIHQWRIEGRDCWFKEGTGICVPYEPFCGVMGVAPPESGRHGTIPPGVHGGNMDIRDLVPGARLTLPVCVPGALFSVGDCHCAQGDGEVSGTAIEAPMSVALRFNLQRAANLAEPQMVAPPPSRRRSERGYFVTTAHGPDLLGGARQATRYMVDHLEGYYGLTRQEAYVLCSAAVDLRISQVVNVPNFTVSAYLPLAIFPS